MSFWAVTLLSLIGRQSTEVSQESSSSDGGITCLVGTNGEMQRRVENITMS